VLVKIDQGKAPTMAAIKNGKAFRRSLYLTLQNKSGQHFSGMTWTKKPSGWSAKKINLILKMTQALFLTTIMKWRTI
jgi:hypothetical protein